MATGPTVTRPSFEHHPTGLGVDTAKPRISWRFESSPQVKSWFQNGYDLEITFGHPGQAHPETQPSETFHIDSEQSVLVPWPARALRPREAATVRVRVYSSPQGQPGPWSEASTVEASLLAQDNFAANFITSPQRLGHPGPLRPIRFRKSFDLPKNTTKGSNIGRLYVTALGVYQVWINGKLASDECMAPGWTSYKHRLAYRVLDVSSLLVAGQTNVICAELGEGWYAGRLSFDGGERYRYGDQLAFAAQLEISSGQDQAPWALVTDDTWQTAASAITRSEIYDGEEYDLAEETEEDWTSASAQWPADKTSQAKIISMPASTRLFAPDAGPVRVTEVIECKNVFKSKSGKTILDFGQNLVGKLCLSSLELPAGHKITLTHAEVMEAGELGTRPLRVAKCQDIIVGGKTTRTLKDWTPTFTFHGFRYVQVDGWPANNGTPGKQEITALVMHTDMKRRGYFECSNPAVNQLHRNVVWSMRGNFLSIPTDCPQRDERLGWTGDLQAFCPTATFLYDTLGMLGSWLEDLSAEQLAPGEFQGIVPLVVPKALPSAQAGLSQAIWGDVSVLAPRDLYQYSSDTGLLERQFASMQAWLDKGIKRDTDGLWDPNLFQLGDWLDPNAPPDDPAQASTDSILVANAFLIHVTEAFARLCAALGKSQDVVNNYTEQAEDLRSRFRRRYITPDGNLVSLSQTGIALAVQFGLYEQEDKPRQLAANTLATLVRKAAFHISTGFAGTPVITHALTSIGQPQLAYGMLLESNCPSWLYPVVKMDATTIWERWDSMLPDGSINPGEMTSFNHYALGAVADWLHGSVGGIAPLQPGWKVIRVRPVPGGNLSSAKVSFDGPYGLVACDWSLDEARTRFRMTLTVPPNCSAVVTLPNELRRDYRVAEESAVTVESGVHEFECDCDLGSWPPKALSHPFRQEAPANEFAGEKKNV